MALTVLSGYTSCYNDDRLEGGAEKVPAAQYINITVGVSTSDNRVTRSPLGGEYGDGAEKGSDAENMVRNITLIFYEDVSGGINTTSEDAAVACVKTYIVTPVSNYEPENHEHKAGEDDNVKTNEVLYTTGDQRLDETSLVAGSTYRVLVAANVDLNVKVGDKISTVRDQVYSNALYTIENGVATDFVMTSESDATVSLTNPTQKTTGENRFVYYFNCIHMERLAARIDYDTTGAAYDGDRDGYKYLLGSDENDGFFVVTKVTPFNLYNESEYVFKRVRNNWTDASPVISRLGNESTTNYVVDPNTADKDGSHMFTYLSPIAQNMDNGYTKSMSSDQNKNKSNIVITYARENTLKPASPLKKYATGLAFEIKYYVTPTAEPVTRVYYHYLRHQGEKPTGSYQAYLWSALSDETTCGTTPMNYGIVRNNIYRVKIEGFTPLEGVLKVTIEEKHWRHVDNPTIYI